MQCHAKGLVSWLWGGDPRSYHFTLSPVTRALGYKQGNQPELSSNLSASPSWHPTSLPSPGLQWAGRAAPGCCEGGCGWPRPSSISGWNKAHPGPVWLTIRHGAPPHLEPGWLPHPQPVPTAQGSLKTSAKPAGAAWTQADIARLGSSSCLWHVQLWHLALPCPPTAFTLCFLGEGLHAARHSHNSSFVSQEPQSLSLPEDPASHASGLVPPSACPP